MEKIMMVKVDWLARCFELPTYSCDATLQKYGYSYPKHSSDLVCCHCSVCNTLVCKPISEFWRHRHIDYVCKVCSARKQFSKRKEAMFKARDEFWVKDENKKWASELAKAQEHRKTVMEQNNQNPEFQEKRKSGYIKSEASPP